MSKVGFLLTSTFVHKGLSAPALGLYTCIKALKYIGGPGVRWVVYRTTGPLVLAYQTNRIYDGVEAETRKSQAILWLFKSHARLCRAWEEPSMRLEKCENEPEISLSRPQHHHWLFFSHIILSISTASNEVAILSVGPRIQKCNMQHSIIINCLKENRTFIFVYLIIHVGK